MSSVCRVCLAGDVRMEIVQDQLQQIFERLTNTKFEMEGLPNSICYVCSWQLLKLHNLCIRARRSQTLFQDMLRTTTQITDKSFGSNLSTFTILTQTLAIDQNGCSLPTPCQNTANIYICKYENVRVKEEITVKKEITDEEMVEIEIQRVDAVKQENELKYSCKICDMKFPTKRLRGTHSKTHSQLEKQKYICDKCSKAYVLKYNLQHHLKGHTDKPLTCPCERIFTHKSQYNKHMKSHSDEKPYVCDRCSKTFKETGQLKEHIRTHTGEKPYCCDRCSKKFATSNQLSTHMLVHTGDRRFACNLCGKTFALKGNLATHMRTHTGEKPYHCPRCNMAFALKCTMMGHIRGVHSGADRPYPCQTCDMTFTEKRTLTGHVTRFHSENKPYSCDKCGKSFTKVYSLNEHMKTHLGVREHACGRCGRAFYRKDHLKTHQTSSKCAQQT